MLLNKPVPNGILPRIVILLLHGANTIGQFADGISGPYDAHGNAVTPLALFIPARTPFIGDIEINFFFSLTCDLQPNGVIGTEECETVATIVGGVVETTVSVPFQLLSLAKTFDVQPPVVIGDRLV